MLKPHMLEDARNYSEVLDAASMAFDTEPRGVIPVEICNLAQLIELLEMVGEDAIKQAVYSEMARDTRETQADQRASGYCQ